MFPEIWPDVQSQMHKYSEVCVIWVVPHKTMLHVNRRKLCSGPVAPVA